MGRLFPVTLAALGAGACFLPIPRAMRPPDPIAADSVAAANAARRDSIAAAEREAARQDSIAQVQREAARQDSIARAEQAAAARRDSIARAERAAAARRDSIARVERAAAARRDSILEAERAAARRDSMIAAARRDSLASIEVARAAVEAELAALRESGPAYIAVNDVPRLVWDTEAEAALATTLLPVIRREGLDADIAASIWLLVRTDGRVEATAIHASSGDQSFDAAAARAARALLFAPALLDGRPTPVWVLREISLLMR